MKKLISIILTLVLIAGFMVTPAFAAEPAAISITSKTVEAGDTFTVEVSITNNPGFVSAKVTLDYDKDALELTAMENVMFQGVANKDTGIANHSGVKTVTGDGVLFTATFTVKVDAEQGEYEIDAAVTSMRDGEDKLFTPTVTAGIITVTDHVDAEPKDHKCDLCDEELSKCADADNDHKCDYCTKELSKCADADNDHKCDICEEVLTECADADKDHKCDACEEVLTECGDANKDHKCDICAKELSKCADENDDHKCDICTKVVTPCVDKDNDHKCDTCGEDASECEDDNKDHKCDICEKVLGECADADKDHKCDTCKKELSECADADYDHACDVCGETLSECADVNEDGKCDSCGADLEEETVSEVIRISGKERTATARKIADELKAITGAEQFDAIVYASGDVFADALAGTYLANMENAPILLYRAGSAEENQAYIEKNLAEDGFVYILGGTKAIPASVDNALKEAEIQVVRLSGKTRFETNIEILEETGFAGGETVLVCTGYEYADSLSASATGMPILLVEKGAKELRDAQVDYLKGLDAKCEFIVIGGSAAVSAELVDALETYDADGKVERLSGKTRYETSIKLAETFFTSDRIVLAYGREFADGLCGGSLAYTLGVPVVLAEESMADVVAEYTKEAKITSGYVLGGTARLTDKPVRTIFQMAASDEIVVK